MIDPQRGSLAAAATQELKDVQTNREETLYDKGHDILKSCLGTNEELSVS